MNDDTGNVIARTKNNSNCNFFHGFTGQFDSTEHLSDFFYGIVFYMRIVRV